MARAASDNVTADWATWTAPWAPATPNHSTYGLITCPNCSAVIPEPEKYSHVEWHRRLWNLLENLARS